MEQNNCLDDIMMRKKLKNKLYDIHFAQSKYIKSNFYYIVCDLNSCDIIVTLYPYLISFENKKG